jgi:glycosyltransferase involved in cell wall biosynthesis
MFRKRWFKYSCFSGTSEDPFVFVGVLALLYNKKSFLLVDEIKAGSYRGDRSEIWKRICKQAIKKSKFNIVNDKSRIKLLRDYASLTLKKKIIVYPGCYVQPPVPNISPADIKKTWGFPENAFVVGSSGGFNMTAGADWLINSLKDMSDIYSVIQPLGVSPLSLFLLETLDYRNRLYIQKDRLSWEDAWKQSIGFNIGLCIYTNPAPQFQLMGVSSNRLCMFIAMGVPVIATKQESFRFLEEYQCGILVTNYTEFKTAVHNIREKYFEMRQNCHRCFNEYINPSQHFQNLKTSINNLFQR